MKKQRLDEKLGGGSRIGLGGVNSSGPYNPRYRYNNPSGYHTGGHQGDADSLISQRMSQTLEESEKEEEEKVEEENLYEFFARIAKLNINENKNESTCNVEEGYCSTHESSCTMKESQCDESIRIEEEKELDEMSAGGVAGVATPLGTNSKGKVPSKKERKNRIDHAIKTFGGK